MPSGDQFYFDKTDLFKKIKRLEDIVGVGDIDVNEIVTKLNEIEQIVANINSTYTNRTYVDNNLLSKVSKTGDTLLGNIFLLVAPVEDAHITTKGYVDIQSSNRVSKFGDVLYGELILANNATQSLHPISKQQFDVAISTVAQTGNLDW